MNTFLLSKERGRCKLRTGSAAEYRKQATLMRGRKIKIKDI